jgi:hypothetical protein
VDRRKRPLELRAAADHQELVAAGYIPPESAPNRDDEDNDDRDQSQHDSLTDRRSNRPAPYGKETSGNFSGFGQAAGTRLANAKSALPTSARTLEAFHMR